MARVTDITDKLNFEENPKLKIKNTEYEVNADAATVLKIMQVIGDGKSNTPKDVVDMYNLIFSEAERKKIEKIKLQYDDFQTVVMAAINLVSGASNSGE